MTLSLHQHNVVNPSTPSQILPHNLHLATLGVDHPLVSFNNIFSKFTYECQTYPQMIASQEEAQQLVSDAHQMRLRYEETRSLYLLHLKQALADVQQVDLQLFHIDMHIGQLQHLICKSGLQEIPPAGSR
jgi:hypothetical protein